ncbi:MAG: endonuclease/exonuclease/phosphatase family protein [Acidobacteriota bacterium]
MRIVTWNCQMGLDKKAHALLALTPDVAVVPECSEKSASAFRHHGYESLWFGSNPVKGLGIFCRKEWSLRALPQARQKWIVPVVVDAPTPFILIAVWACRVGSKKADHYVGQVYQALMAHPDWFDGRPVVLAGDLNSNQIWDSERLVGNHSDVVRVLAERGLVSGYHEFFNQAHGMETSPTMHLYRHSDRPYHLDYIFVPQEWMPHLKMVDVGTFADWSKLSDHCPVTVDI